jgi:hypothetical protein
MNGSWILHSIGLGKQSHVESVAPSSDSFFSVGIVQFVSVRCTFNCEKTQPVARASLLTSVASTNFGFGAADILLYCINLRRKLFAMLPYIQKLKDWRVRAVTLSP